MGAVLGQGYSFGRPLTLPVAGDASEPFDVPQTYEQPDVTTSPFETASPGPEGESSTKWFVRALFNVRPTIPLLIDRTVSTTAS